MYVELDIFSGRPNPRWETAAADDARIITSISGLSRIAEERAPVDRLGYRGFVVTDEQRRAFERLRVFGSVVEILTAAAVTTYRTPIGRSSEHSSSWHGASSPATCTSCS